MTSIRPRLKIPFESFDIVIECISITILLLMWLYVIKEYSLLPETVASHFNAKGEANNYSNKSIVFLIPSIATGIYLLLFMVNRFPHLHNYMINITEDNAFKNYRFSTRVLRIVNLLCAGLIGYVTYYIIETAKEKSMSLGSLFLPIVIGLSIILPVVLFLYQRKLNKE